MKPMCPEHHKELREGKFGFFCPTLVTTTAQGKKIWCDYKYEADPPATPQNQPIVEPLDTWAPSTKTPIKTETKEPDWDKIALGKTRSLFIAAIMQKRGLEPITQGDIDLIEGWLEYAFTGAVKKFPNPYPRTNEDVDPSEKELEQIFSK